MGPQWGNICIKRAGGKLRKDRDGKDGFPVLKIGKRIVIPKDKFLLWIEKQYGKKS